MTITEAEKIVLPLVPAFKLSPSPPKSMPLAAMDLSVVIPIHNEEHCLPTLIEEIEAALEKDINYEIICVDDGSSDGTPRYLALLQHTHPRLRRITHRERCGQSAALLTGVRAARAAWVVTLDGDGQNDPADILKLYAERTPTLSAETMILGCRRRRYDSRTKRLSSRIANAVRARLLKDGVPDTGCGLKLFTRSTFLQLPYFDHMHRFLPALFMRAGGRVITLEVNHRPRLYGASHYGVHNRLWTGLIDMLGVFWLQRRIRRPVIEHDTTYEQ